MLLLGAFIKFFIFGEFPCSSSSNTNAGFIGISSSKAGEFSPGKVSAADHLRHRSSNSNVLRQVTANATDTKSILRKTYYQTLPPTAIKGEKNGRTQTHHSSHQPESLDWFNVLIAQTIAQYRQTAYNVRETSSLTPSVLSTLDATLNDPEKRPSFVDHIKVIEISLGEEFPIFSNCRVIETEDENASSRTGGRLQALMDVDLADDNLTLAIETALTLNYPVPCSAILPVSLAVSVVRFSGTLAIGFVPAESTEENNDVDQEPEDANNDAAAPKTNLNFSFLPDYRLELSVRSLVGSRSRLQDVPKIAHLVEARVLAWFEERVVEPRVQVVPLPGLWPKMGKTRVREGEEARANEDGRKDDAANIYEFARRRTRPTSHEDPFSDGVRLRGGQNGRFTPDIHQDNRRMPGSMPA